jgi:hypothetical protein
VLEHDPPTTIVMDDFESGGITDWKAVGGGAGRWSVYSDGKQPNVLFDLPDPPQGEFALGTEVNGPGTRILYRDVKLDGEPPPVSRRLLVG